ncbi:MAG: hypothetical protein SGJ18_13655 [Pseudomonadota bacterium]|nr:hypothetical protein [Pseudomonadota bacterium]
MKETILCRGSLSFASCIGAGTLLASAGKTAISAATAKSKRLSRAEKIAVAQLEKELRPLHERHLKAIKGAQAAVKITRAEVYDDAARVTQNNILGQISNGTYERKMGYVEAKAYENKLAQMRSLTGLPEAQITKGLEIAEARLLLGKTLKYLIPGLGAAAITYDVADYTLTASPIACQQLDEKYMSLDGECKNDFETVSESSRKFLMMPAIDQEQILKTNPRLCDHYQKMLEHMKRHDEGFEINSLNCSDVTRQKAIEVKVSKLNSDGTYKTLTHKVNLDNSRQPEKLETYDSETKEGSRIFFKQVTGFTYTNKNPESVTEITDIQYQIPIATRGVIDTALTPISAKPESEALATRHAQAIKHWYGLKSYLPKLVSCCMDTRMNSRNQRESIPERECIESVSGKIARESQTVRSGAPATTGSAK